MKSLYGSITSSAVSCLTYVTLTMVLSRPREWCSEQSLRTPAWIGADADLRFYCPMASVLMSMVICLVSLGSDSEKIQALTSSRVRLDEGVAQAAFVEIHRQSASTDPNDARRRLEAGRSGHALDDLFHSASQGEQLTVTTGGVR